MTVQTTVPKEKNTTYRQIKILFAGNTSHRCAKTSLGLPMQLFSR